MRSKLWMMTIGLAVVAVAWLLHLVRSEQQRSRREIAQLGATNTRLEAATQRRPALGAALATDHVPAGSVEALARAAARDEARRAIEEQGPQSDDAGEPAGRPGPTFEQSQQHVIAAFAEEAVDPTWSDEATRKLEDIVRSHLPAGSRLGSVECHSTMCQVEITHTDPSVAGHFLVEGFRGWPGSLFVTSEEQKHGDLRVKIIAAREGTEPPIAPR